MLDQITPIILTFNEEPNIGRTLSALTWANEVVIIDSGSTDNTLAICAEFENTRLVHRSFDIFANQSNFALKQNIVTEWVLSMDADYVLTPELIRELEQLKSSSDVNGYTISFKYLISGKTLRGTLYPPRLSLYKRKFAHYKQDGHTQRVVVNGVVESLKEKILHDDRKPYKRWLKSQWNYAQQEAKKLTTTKWGNLSTPDKLRKSGLAPLIILPYTLIFKGLILNGAVGLTYAAQRLIAEVYLQVARFKSN